MKQDSQIQRWASNDIQLAGPSHSGSVQGQGTSFDLQPNTSVHLKELADPSYPQSEMEDDTMSDEEHANLVDYLEPIAWSACDEDRRAKARRHLLQHLAVDYNKIDPKYSLAQDNSKQEIERLFESNPWLVSVVDAGWREQSYRKICRLSQHAQALCNLPLSQYLRLPFVEILRPRKPEIPTGRDLDEAWLGDGQFYFRSIHFSTISRS
jgi:hypothetical protein